MNFVLKETWDGGVAISAEIHWWIACLQNKRFVTISTTTLSVRVGVVVRTWQDLLVWRSQNSQPRKKANRWDLCPCEEDDEEETEAEQAQEGERVKLFSFLAQILANVVLRPRKSLRRLRRRPRIQEMEKTVMTVFSAFWEFFQMPQSDCKSVGKPK
jgi:hypothetical protein